MLARLLSSFANQTAARFNSPVYLVGSALHSAISRDVDIVVILTDIQWKQRYGIGLFEHENQNEFPSIALVNYWKDIAKISKWVSDNYEINIDFKIQNESLVRAREFDKHDRLRLDSLGDLNG